MLHQQPVATIMKINFPNVSLYEAKDVNLYSVECVQ